MAQLRFAALRHMAHGNHFYVPNEEGQDGEDTVRELVRKGFARVLGEAQQRERTVLAVDVQNRQVVSRPIGAETPEDKLPPPVTPESAAPPIATPESGDLRKQWTLKSTPAVYLKRAPNGPQAELAKQMIIAGFGNYAAS